MYCDSQWRKGLWQQWLKKNIYYSYVLTCSADSFECFFFFFCFFPLLPTLLLILLALIPIPKKGNAKECSNYRTITLISHASKVMLKILQARLQQYVNCELPDVQSGFRKGRRTRDQIADIHWIIEKARDFQENIYFCLVTMPKPLTVWIKINCGKFWKRWEYQTTWPTSLETCMQVRRQL